MLEIEVCEIMGKCPIHKVGDQIVIDDPTIVLERTDALYVYALSSLLHYFLILESGADSVKLGLSKPKNRDAAYIQCVDPGEPYTEGGTVIFKIKKVKQEGVSQ